MGFLFQFRKLLLRVTSCSHGNIGLCEHMLWIVIFRCLETSEQLTKSSVKADIFRLFTCRIMFKLLNWHLRPQSCFFGHLTNVHLLLKLVFDHRLLSMYVLMHSWAPVNFSFSCQCRHVHTLLCVFIHALPHIPFLICECVSVCAHGINVNSVLWGGGERVEVVGSPGCPPCVYLGKAAPPRPCPCPLLEQTKALLASTSAMSGTYHSGRTGEQQPPHRLNGHTVERGLSWPGVAYLRILVHIMKRLQCKWCI